MREIESKKDMTKFFENNLAVGHNVEEIYAILLNQGYPKSLINSGYNEAIENIRKRKEAQREKELAQRPKIETITTATVPEKKQGFFSKLFHKK